MKTSPFFGSILSVRRPLLGTATERSRTICAMLPQNDAKAVQNHKKKVGEKSPRESIPLPVRNWTFWTFWTGFAIQFVVFTTNSQNFFGPVQFSLSTRIVRGSK